jgi:hypothetical protein
MSTFLAFQSWANTIIANSANFLFPVDRQALVSFMYVVIALVDLKRKTRCCRGNLKYQCLWNKFTAAWCETTDAKLAFSPAAWEFTSNPIAQAIFATTVVASGMQSACPCLVHKEFSCAITTSKTRHTGTANFYVGYS